jgi:hypothetical protein
MAPSTMSFKSAVINISILAPSVPKYNERNNCGV